MKTTRSKMRLQLSLMALGGLLTYLVFGTVGGADPTFPENPTIPMDAQPITGLPYVINQPGSYYLTQNLTYTSQNSNAIEIHADNVTINLAGYGLFGPGSGSGHGIYMNGRKNVEICNGTVAGFGGNGIYEAHDEEGYGHRIICLRVMSNGGHGIILWGSKHLVKCCTVTYNCFALSSGYGAVTCGTLSKLYCNVISSNYLVGIVTNQGCLIKENVVCDNYFGIQVPYGCSVFYNVVAYNNDFGIQAYYEGNYIKYNAVRNCATGIVILGYYNCLEQNHVTSCDTGFHFEDSRNVYAGNRSLGNGTNYGGTVPTSSYDGGGNIGAGAFINSNAGVELMLQTERSMPALSIPD